MTPSSSSSNVLVAKAGAGEKCKLTKEEKDCIMLYVLINMTEVLDFMR